MINEATRWPSRLPVVNLCLYSDLKLFTGLATAAFTAWKLTVTNVMINALAIVMTNTYHVIGAW
jgi:hypothetical protein